MTFASWMVPLGVTLVVWALAMLWPVSAGGIFNLNRLFLGVAALIVTLIAWLVWAIATRS